ncbi:MAG: hypothetical protein ABIH45_05350 [Candidatus Omnitrophota bacterium]
MDSIDRLVTIANYDSFRDQVAYYFRREDCHFMPLYLLLHGIFYKLFWLNPAPFHVLIILTFILSGFTLMRLILELIDSWIAAMFSGVLFCWSTSYLRLMDIVCWPYLFTLLLILLAFLGVSMYAKTDRVGWNVLASLMAFLAPCMYAIGVPIGLWIAAFYFLCVPAENKGNLGKKLRGIVPVLSSWLFGASIYYSTVHPIDVFLGRVADQSIINFSYISQAAWLTLKSLWLYDIPLMTPFRELSLFLAYFLIIMALIRRRQVSWRIVSFFLVWSVVNYFFVYYVRGNFGSRLLNAEWYHFYPFVGFVAVYSVIVGDILKDRVWVGLRFKKSAGVIVLFVMAFYANIQQGIVLTSPPQNPDLYTIGAEFCDSLTGYLQETGKQRLVMSNHQVSLGGLNLAAKDMKLYTTLFLPGRLYEKIAWGQQTDVEFIFFLRSNKGKFLQLKKVLEDGGYF